jgi:rhamnogalacturonyl hydrolase YesR
VSERSPQLNHDVLSGSYWYYVYRNVTTQDGLFSIPSFKALYAQVFLDSDAMADEYVDAARQFSNIVECCLSNSTGLFYHGYDPTRSYPIWGNLTSRGHSESIWGRAVGWTVTGLLLTLDVIPATDPNAAELRVIFAQLMKAILQAQDSKSGAWWQVMNFPDWPGNFLESSATGLFAYAMFRGVRLGYLNGTDGVSVNQYVHSAKLAYGWLQKYAVLDLGDGTLGYNLTVDVCSINSTTGFDVRLSFSLPLL